MNQFIISKYIQRITKEDIYKFASTQGITLTNNELDIIYYYIKNKYASFLSGNQLEILNEIKHQVTPTTYQKIEELYNLYKNKI